MKVTYFDKDGAWKALRRLAAQLAAEHPEITRIAVFGSLARDEAVPGSDVDLLLLLERSDVPVPERFDGYRPARFPVGLDIFAYTREEVEQMLVEGNFFLKRALAEGITLFQRQSGR